MSPGVILHVAAGLVAIMAGGLALVAAKGGRLHRRSGTVFAVAMLVAAAMAVWLAARIPQPGNVLGGVFTLYLVVTGWAAVKTTTMRFKLVCLVAAAAIAATGLVLGVLAARSATGQWQGVAAPNYIVVAVVALLAAGLDLKVIWRGALARHQRLARHLWRMCTALFVGTGSFFLGQQKVMPAMMRGAPLLFVLALAPLAAMMVWLVMLRVRTHRERSIFSAALSDSSP